MRNYAEANREFPGLKPRFHPVEVTQVRKFLDESALDRGIQMNQGQIGLAWLPLNKLHPYRFYSRSWSICCLQILKKSSWTKLTERREKEK